MEKLRVEARVSETVIVRKVGSLVLRKLKDAKGKGLLACEPRTGTM